MAIRRVMKGYGRRHKSVQDASRGLGGHDDGASGGRRGGRERTAPVMKTGNVGDVGLSHLQCVLWTKERF